MLAKLVIGGIASGVMRPVAISNAAGLRMYPSSRIIDATRFRVAKLMPTFSARPFATRETVVLETPAASATSRILGPVFICKIDI